MTQVNPSTPQYVLIPDQQQGNLLGVIGFVFALVGVFSGGLLSIVGLVLSLVALAAEGIRSAGAF